MNQRFLLSVLFLSVLFLTAFRFISDDEKDYSQCVKKFDVRWGETCSQCKDSNKSYRVSLRNTCNEALDVKCAVQESDKRWRTFSFMNLHANDTLQAYACNGVGKYRVWARKAGDRINEFPTDDEINAQYSK